MNTQWSDGELIFSYTRLDELNHISAMLAKDSVCEHVFFGPNTPEQTRGYFGPLLIPMWAALERGTVPETHIFTIREPAGGQFVGECAVIPVAYGAGNYIIGYQLDEPWWGRGYGTRACEFTIWYGFDMLAAHRLSGDCLASNLGSARILQKCGFQQEGRQPRYYNARGSYRDNLLFGLLRDQVEGDRLSALKRRFQTAAEAPPASSNR